MWTNSWISTIPTCYIFLIIYYAFLFHSFLHSLLCHHSYHFFLVKIPSNNLLRRLFAAMSSSSRSLESFSFLSLPLYHSCHIVVIILRDFSCYHFYMSSLKSFLQDSSCNHFCKVSLITPHVLFLRSFCHVFLSYFLEDSSWDHSCHVPLIIILLRSFLVYFLKCLSYRIIILSLSFASCHETTLNKTLFKYCPPRWIWQKVGSFNRSLLKSEAGRFSEKLIRPPSCESPLKFKAPPCFLIGWLETNCQQPTQLCQRAFIHYIWYNCWQRWYEQSWNL